MIFETVTRFNHSELTLYPFSNFQPVRSKALPSIDWTNLSPISHFSAANHDRLIERHSPNIRIRATCSAFFSAPFIVKASSVLENNIDKTLRTSLFVFFLLRKPIELKVLTYFPSVLWEHPTDPNINQHSCYRYKPSWFFSRVETKP